jgi:hypothetical protein
MKQAIKGVVLSVALAAAGAASAQVTSDQCRRLIGFQGAKLGAPTGAWLAVNTVADADGFRGKKEIPGNCEIKDPILQAKGKPLPGTAFTVQGPMPQDQCSMYKYLGSIDLAVNSNKLGSALTSADSMLTKVNELFTTGKLTQDGYNALQPAARAVRDCIDEYSKQS